ncbi:MAG: DNA polymerase III subunit alpha [Erysipelotrichaceae bacterium]|nr:DNA polymerase III subunit alpha [Erysipelotrichaceae bacterium]
MFNPLYIRSVYNLLSSMCPIEKTVKKAFDNGAKSLGIVDKNTLSYAMHFKKECEKYSIKPIYGMEVDVRLNERFYPVILYARNDEGFKRMMALSSLINTSDEKILDIETFRRYKDDCFVVLESDNMPLTVAIDRGEDIYKALALMEESFGNFLVGIMDHDLAINCNRDVRIKEILVNTKFKTIALHRTYYLERDDYKDFEVLKCIRDKKTLDENAYYESGRFFLSEDEYESLYDFNDLKNAAILADACNVTMDFKTSLPVFKTPEGISSKDYLIALAKEGLRRRLKNMVPPVYTKRLEYELKTIVDMHFEDYFLIVYDFILFAKKKGIMVGPGRGSCGGSLVCFCLGISEIDPIKYGLLFERFLNPERITMPDIDTDFPDDRRDEVFEYVKNKYGVDYVGHIVTYGTLKAKQVLRDVGRVLNYSNYDIDALAKAIPFNASLMEAYNNSNLFRQKIESEEKFRRLFKVALKLESYPRHESTHAAGVVMSSKKLYEVVPVTRIENDINSTQYTMEYLESLGLIKMDFLGLRNLGIIAEVVDEINKNEKFNIKDIPLDDKKTFKLIKDVNVLGVFQLESSGMQSLARRMKPDNFLELGMMIALFRPGPMENIPLFLENRAHPEKITYLVPQLKPILEETYGIIVYQEQIMTIARVLAGFSYAKADLLRRAMSKKKAAELEKLQDDFINGCVNNGYKKEVAQSLYDLVLKFANYGFNKSHSIAYGLVAYQMAYLKANYPLYFYKALLNGVIGSEVKTYEYIKECQNVGLKVRGISLNESALTYQIKDNSIVMPLCVCKDVGYISANKIIEERKKGTFKDYIDTVCRLLNAGVEKNVIENLIMAGGFDFSGFSRYTMSNSLPNVLKYASAHKGGIQLLDLDDAPIIENMKDDVLVRAEKEKSVLGFYFSFNPILEVKRKNNIDTRPIRELLENQGRVTGFGMIRRVKTHKTKKGEMMCFIDVSDDSGDISLAVMPLLFKTIENTIGLAKYVYFEGNMEKAASVLVKKLKTF